MLDNTLKDFILTKVDDLKGQDIITIDIRNKSCITDYMVICTGTSSQHVISIADYVVKEVRITGLPILIEGKNTADWIVVDLGDVILHIMQKENRCLYELEKLWSDTLSCS